MASYYYTACLQKDGEDALYVECEIDGEVTDEGGTCEPFFRVDWVATEVSSPIKVVRNPVELWERLAAEIAKLVQADADFLRRAMDEEGWVYRGLGGNDPDGEWVRPRDLEVA